MRAGGRRDPASGLSRDTGRGKGGSKVLCERTHITHIGRGGGGLDGTV